MKRVKVFFAVAALLLVTAGVFAGKARFTTGIATNLYYYDAGTYVPIALTVSSSGNSLGYQSTLSHTVANFNPAGTDFPMYYYSGTANVWYTVYFQ